MTTTQKPADKAKVLQRLRTDPKAFRAALLIDSDAGPQRLGAIIDPFQSADFEKLDSGWKAVAFGNQAAPVLRAWLERPRGHSKTSDIAIMVTWAMFASGRKITGITAAADRDQAKLIRDAVQKLVQNNPWLKEFVEVQEAKIVNPTTESTCTIISSDVASSYGLLCDFIICDELTHWRDRGLWDSLLSTAAKRKNCLLLVITNAGFKDSWQWTIREAVRIDAAWYFSRLDGPVAKWITQDRLDEQRRLLPDIAFRRLWKNEWSGGSGDAIHPDDLVAALKALGPMLAAEQGWSFVAGLDLSVSHDATALVVLGISVGWTETKDVPQRKPSPINRALIDAGLIEPRRNDERPQTIHHPGTGRIRLSDLRVWEPSNGSRVELSAVEAAIVDAHERYGLSAVAVDPFQAALMVERLQRRGIPIYTLDQTGITLQAQASAVLDGFRERIIDLFPHDQLLADLRGLQIAERNYGFRLISPRATRTDTHATAHGDTATAFSLAMLTAKRAALRPGRTVPGDLVCWPRSVVA